MKESQILLMYLPLGRVVSPNFPLTYGKGLHFNDGNVVFLRVKLPEGKCYH